MGAIFLGLGVGPGIGASTAMRFAREGYRPVLVARNPQTVASLAQEIREATGQHAEALSLDLRDSLQIQGLVERYGSEVQVLHYNAAVVRTQPLENLSFDALNNDIAINITGALMAIKAFTPHFRARGTGTILLTGGGLALNPAADQLTLSVGKAGIRCMAQSLFPVLEKQGVHIATLTIHKYIEARSVEARAVGEAFWKIHAQQRGQWTWEEHFS